LDVVRNHAFAVARRGGDWEVIESAEIKLSKEELAGLNADLERRVEAATSDLRTTLAHKDALLREVHHRVKNNLQIVSSLLLLKGRSATEEARRVLAESADRVRSIAAVHEALYGGLEGDRVQLNERLGVIARSLAASYGVADRVAVEVRGDDVRLPLEHAMPAALIATEGVANAFKHGFPGARRGRVDVCLTERARGFELVIEDDGVGWNAEEAKRGSGLDIMMALARQLEGEVALEPVVSGGTRFRLTAGVQGR
jgi:two-component sensor histidine kinase